LVCSAAGALAYVFKQQPMILGFLIAGILIGPFGLIKDTEMLKNHFSDIAIVLLLFGIGLSFPLKQLGEFSVIVLKTGQDLGVISSMLFPIIGMAVALTTFIGPMLVKVGSRIVVVYE
jgi:CPA2 family monovalent cation:H+ antiporter-2